MAGRNAALMHSKTKLSRMPEPPAGRHQISWKRREGGKGIVLCGMRTAQGTGCPPVLPTEKKRGKVGGATTRTTIGRGLRGVADDARGCRCQASSSNVDEPASSQQKEKEKRKKSLKAEAMESNNEVYDRLIEIFRAKRKEEWRKLIVYSSQWPSLAEGVFARIEHRANEASPDDQLELRRFLRRLKGVHEETSRHRDLLEEFRTNASREWESMVAQYRGDMTQDFFEFIEIRIKAAEMQSRAREGKHTEGDGGGGGFTAVEAEALAALGSQLAILVDAYDRVMADEQALASAGENFAQLLETESLEGMEAKLDTLAASGKLDPALLLTMAKAYSGVKETDITKEEVKDIMAHLYFKAKEKFASQAPPEARILKFLLTIDVESERIALMEQAFQPGADISTTSEDYIHTTPPALLNTIENILAVYDGSSSGSMGMAGEAASLMDPEVISRLRQLQATIRKNFM